MKKIKFIFINSIVIMFASAFFTFAADVKDQTAKTSPAPASSTFWDKIVSIWPAKTSPAPASSSPASAKPVAPASVKPATAKTQAAPAAVAANATVPTPINPAASAPPAAKVAPPGPVQPSSPSANAPAANVTAANVTAQAAVSTGETYNYNPVGKPDPFRPFIALETVEKKKVEKKEPLSIFPLQRAETENYRVVGIAGDEENRVAIAEDAAKKFYPLVKGTRIGLHNGKVVEILSDRVIVEESDTKKPKRVILKLRKD